MILAGERGPLRTCLGCRKVVDRQELLRFVLDPQGQLLVDYKGRLPGRGAYTCVDQKCIEEAIRRRQFSRTFKRELQPICGDDLKAELRRQIQDRIYGLIGMARKSNQLISGSGLILDRLAAGAALAFIVIARDVSDGIGDKVAGRAVKRSIPYYQVFEKEYLGRLLGTGQRSVLALLPGSLATAARVELDRYQRIAGEY